MKYRFLAAMLAFWVGASTYAQNNAAPVVPWIKQGNVYEVNVRQYTPEGTFNAFAKHLPRLKAMGVQTLWFMPITPISVKDRKGHLGSYYAVANYTQVSPEFGTLTDWKALVKQCHALGFKVIIDWVANHTGADNPWLTKHPQFFKRDAAGNAMVAYDWTDTRKLDYANAELADSMIAAMKYWVTETGIDGFRCDVAMEVPASFWSKCIKTLQQTKPLFMLAEGDDAWLHEAGFNASYCWEYFAMSKRVAMHERPAFALDSVLTKYKNTYPANFMKLYFTSNHDENSWNKADYATMPGAIHAPFAVLTFTLPNSLPLIYSGQEEPVADSISFFYKDAIPFKNYNRAPFYQKLIQLRNSIPALAYDANGYKVGLADGKDNVVYAFVREAGNSKVLVVVNLSRRPQTITLVDKAIRGKATEMFSNKVVDFSASKLTVEPWGYQVYKF
ncbi:MAG: hypothetical protein EAZ47_00365 [Bacteroidetes bacterium]|nr:MAG: hypothetical protein EAZ47_00365 [Bacteroidota bacterium]